MKHMKPALVAFALIASPACAQELVLKLHHFLPPQATIQAQVFNPWCEKVGRDPGEIERSTSIGEGNADDIDALVEVGCTHLIVSADGPDYDLSLLHDVLAWRAKL